MFLSLGPCGSPLNCSNLVSSPLSIGLLYSCIAPLVLPFVLLFFLTRYFVYLHQFLYVYEREIESGGQCYPRAFRHIYTGLFLFQLTMIGLFAIQPGGAVPQLIIMVICLIVTAFAMLIYDRTFKPMLKYLPVSLANPAVPVDLNDISPDSASHKFIGNKQQGANEADDLERNASGPVKGDNADMQHIDRPREIPADAKHDEDANAYMHPSLIANQPTVWLAEDDMGITQRKLQELQARNIKATAKGATIPRNKKGNPTKVQLDEDRYSAQDYGVPYDEDSYLPCAQKDGQKPIDSAE